MQQKCMKPRHASPIEPAQFLLKSLDDIAAGKAGRAAMVEPVALCVTFKPIKCLLYVCCLELSSGNAEGSLKKAEEVMKIVQGWSEKEVPNKKEVLGSRHSCIGNALFDLGDTDKALKHHQRDFELAEQR